MVKKLFVLAALTVIIAPGMALADATTEAELRAALQNATNQIAILEDQVAHLQAAQAPQTVEIANLNAQLAARKPDATAPVESAEDKAKAAVALAAVNRRLAAQTVALERSRSAYREAVSSASVETTNNRQLASQLADANHTITTCDAKNATLYKLGNQILDAYSRKDDVFGVVANREPFIGFKRVQLQKTVQDDQDKLYGNQTNP